LNLKTERLANHRAQLTVEIETDELEDAKRKAARKISRQVRIKGFRKGKAPYRLVAQAVGESAILEEAVETLGDNLYNKALEEAEVTPYGPGAFDDFQLEPSPTFVFTVPLQPEVDLNDYQNIRVDFEAPEISDYDVDQALKLLQRRAVEVLDDSVAVAALGNRVTIAVESEFVDGEPQDAAADYHDESEAPDALTADSVAGAEAEQEAPYIPKQGDTFVIEENAIIILDPNEDPFTHGFVGHLIGVEQGASVVFELTIPDDDADETIIGRRVEFHVTMKKIESVSLPELDDDFARRVSRNRGDLEQDLAALRASIREELERAALSQAKTEYCDQVLEKMVEGAEIIYPDVMLDQQIDGMIDELERSLQQQRLSLDDYLRWSSSTKDELREENREIAASSLRRVLVLREFVSAQAISISDEEVAAPMDEVASGFGFSSKMRRLFDTPQMRNNLRNQLLLSQTNEHLYAIGRGEDPAAAFAAMQAEVAENAQRAKERSERLLEYQAEDEAAAAAMAVDEQEDSAAEGDAELEEPRTESAVDEAGDSERAQEA